MLKFKFSLEIDETLKTHNISSLLHGVLMEKLPTDLVEELHHLRFNPIRQRVYREGEQFIWEVVAMHKIAENSLQEIFQEKQQTFLLRHHQTPVTSCLLEKIEISIQELIQKVMNDMENPSRFVTMKILSPMTFKQNRQYIFFPEIRAIFGNLMRVFDYFSSDYKIYDEETLDYICEKVQTVGYSLYSTNFYLEKTKVPAFKGKLTLRFSGDTQFIKLLWLLLYFGEFSGIGIKTSLGMGGILLNKPL